MIGDALMHGIRLFCACRVLPLSCVGIWYFYSCIFLRNAVHSKSEVTRVHYLISVSSCTKNLIINAFRIDSGANFLFPAMAAGSPVASGYSISTNIEHTFSPNRKVLKCTMLVRPLYILARTNVILDNNQHLVILCASQ